MQDLTQDPWPVSGRFSACPKLLPVDFAPVPVAFVLPWHLVGCLAYAGLTVYVFDTMDKRVRVSLLLSVEVHSVSNSRSVSAH